MAFRRAQAVRVKPQWRGQRYTGSWYALDIVFNETVDRPNSRMNDDEFANWSPGEAMLADWSHLQFEWMEGDDDASGLR